MTGHVLKRGSLWAFKVEIGRDPLTGKRKQKWCSGFKTRKAAEAELAKTLHEIQTGCYVPPTRLTVQDVLRRWLSDYAKNRVAGKTYERYEQIIEKGIIPELGAISLARLQPLAIQSAYRRWLEGGRRDGREGGLAPQTVVHYHRVLRKALKQAVRWNLMPLNPADRVEPPSVRQKEIQPLDEVRSAWLVDVSQGTRLYIPIMLAVYAGMRRGEILALKWEDIDLERGRALICRALEFTKAGGCVFKEPKSRKSRRVVILPASLTTALKAHRAEQDERRALLGKGYQENGLVCCVEDGSIWKPPAFDSSYRALLRRRKLTGPRFHVLRHSHASQLLRAGVDPKVISERLGHSKISFTLDQYVHLLPGMQEEAAAKIEASLTAAREKIQPKNIT